MTVTRALLRATLEHARCGHAYAGGRMTAIVTHSHHLAWTVHVLCQVRGR